MPVCRRTLRVVTAFIGTNRFGFGDRYSNSATVEMVCPSGYTQEMLKLR